MEILICLITNVILIVIILVSVAFVTLLEQKVLRGIQIRLGPNKVGYWGLLQPFADAVKLFVKEATFPRIRDVYVYIIIPVLGLFLILTLWQVTPFLFGGLSFEFCILYFIVVRGVRTLPILLSGWVSNSKYSLLGGLRAVAQIVSYEVRLRLVLLRLIWVCSSFDFKILIKTINLAWGCLIFFPLAFVWFASSLAETNRTPYDFSEGESELVSGFNTEYSAGGFVLIFIAEYARIIFIGLLFSIFFLSGTLNIFLILKTFFVVFLFFCVRGTLPRYRYDKLMYLTWKRFLPIRLFCLRYYFWIF